VIIGLIKMKLIIKLFLMLIMFLPVQNSFGQEITAKSEIDTNYVKIGEHIKLILSLEYSGDYKFAWPQIQDSIGKLEILAISKFDTAKVNNKQIIKRSYSITSFDSGSYQIPDFVFVYDKPGFDTPFTVSSSPISVRFNNVPVDTSLAIKDIKTIYQFPITIWEILPYILIVYLLTALVTALYLGIKNWKKKEIKIVKYDSSIPADLEALEALKALESEKLWQNGKYKIYHTRLTDIVRTYSHRRYNINSFEMTSGELIEALSMAEVPLDAFNKLKYLLEIADFAKFAKYEPISDENIQCMNFAALFINLTKSMIITEEEISSTEEETI
jgi:hypothetical protein